MTVANPQYISREELAERIQRELSTLESDDLAWWQTHSIFPFPAGYRDTSHFVVAVGGSQIIYFADDEDEFGIAKLEPSNHVMTDGGLIGDLKYAIRIVQKRVGP